MLDNTLFIPNDVTLNNLSELAQYGATLAERRVCEISELAYDAASFSLEMYSCGMCVYEILSLIAEGLVSKKSKTLSGDGFLLRCAYPEFILASDRAEFARLYIIRLRDLGIYVNASSLLPEREREESFIYVKNALADEAYDVFTQEFSSPHVSYCQSFKAAADAVFSGESSYCLLPLEERGGSRLTPVSELIYRRDLKINSVTPVFGFEGNADMKYALLSSCFTVPTLSPDDDGYLEVRVKVDENSTLSEILSVAGYYGISIYRIRKG